MMRARGPFWLLRWAWAATLGGSLVASVAAWGHEADIIRVRPLPRGAPDGAVEQPGELVEQVTMTEASLLRLAPLEVGQDGQLDATELGAGREAIAAGVWASMPLETSQGEPCRQGESAAALREGYVELTARFSCRPGAGELRQSFRFLSVLPEGYRVLVEGAKGLGFAAGGRQSLTFDAPGAARAATESSSGRADASAGTWVRLKQWVLLGATHIFLGVDHLLFLLALLLVGETWRRVLLIVTAFTVAHSLTLGATALGWVALGPVAARAVEVLIALSLVWVAVGNLLSNRHAHRPWVAFAFGLVHGFGFASVLSELGLGDDVVLGLFGFNLGVELGQACGVLVLFPAILWAGRRAELSRWLTRVGSLGVAAAGGYWLVVRLVG